MPLFRTRASRAGATGARLGDPWARYEALISLDPSSLSTSDRQLLALGGLRTEVNNGGFDQYFFNSSGDLAVEALDAAVALGLDGLAALIQQAIDGLGGGYTADRHRRQEVLASARVGDELERLDAAFYAIEASVDLDAVLSVLVEGA